MDAELPDVVPALTAAGAYRGNRLGDLPVAMTGGLRPDDRRFDVVTGRRPLVEAVLAHLADAEPGVAVSRGVAVHGLLTADDSPDGCPHVVGVVTDDGERIAADLVVDAGGRRSTLPDLLVAAGGRRPEEDLADSGYVYYARHFRSADGSMPTMFGPPLHTYSSLQTATLPADHGYWSVVVVASARDRALPRAEGSRGVAATAGELPARRPVGRRRAGDGRRRDGTRHGPGQAIRRRRSADRHRRRRRRGRAGVHEPLARTRHLVGDDAARRAAGFDPRGGDGRRRRRSPWPSNSGEPPTSIRTCATRCTRASTAWRTSRPTRPVCRTNPTTVRGRSAPRCRRRRRRIPICSRAALDVGGLLARGADVVRRPEVAARLADAPAVAPVPRPRSRRRAGDHRPRPPCGGGVMNDGGGPNAVQRTMQRIASLRPVAFVFRHTFHHIDRAAVGVLGGRTVSGIVAGVPNVMLTSTGARTGRPRTVPLVGIDVRGASPSSAFAWVSAAGARQRRRRPPGDQRPRRRRPHGWR